MGSVALNSKSRLGIFLTLDAFGTLYYPTKPIAVQYLEVARQCGLKADIQVPELEASFRKQFKNQSARHPNYGKSQGMSVETWWNSVVYRAFRPLCRGHEIPDSLRPTLFQHFSSRKAYTLYPDVLYFFKSMRKLRVKYSDPNGPIIIVGVVTNSDNRARSVLESLNLKIEPEWEPSSKTSKSEDSKDSITEPLEDARNREIEAVRQGSKSDVPVLGNAIPWYNLSDDVNFLVTSYATGYEKPNSQIFREADRLAATLPLSRLLQSSPDALLSENAFKAAKLLAESYKLTNIHVGDDIDKDYQGAKDADRQALHLCRGRKGELEDHQVSNLRELAAAIDLLADATFDGNNFDRKPLEAWLNFHLQILGRPKGTNWRQELSSLP